MSAPDRASEIRDFVLAGSCSNCRRLLARELYDMVSAALKAPALDVRLAPSLKLITATEVRDLGARAFASGIVASTHSNPEDSKDERVIGVFAAVGFYVFGAVSCALFFWFHGGYR